MRSELALIVLVAACGARSDEPPREHRQADRVPAEPRRIDSFVMTPPDGWRPRYDVATDRWHIHAPPMPPVDGPTTTVTFERAPSPSVAGPDALRHHMLTREWERGTSAEIETRQPLSDGFATLLRVQAPDASAPHRQLHVVRELGSEWFRCIGGPIVDDATRDHVLSLCRSVKRAAQRP